MQMSFFQMYEAGSGIKIITNQFFVYILNDLTKFHKLDELNLNKI